MTESLQELICFSIDDYKRSQELYDIFKLLELSAKHPINLIKIGRHKEVIAWLFMQNSEFYHCLQQEYIAKMREIKIRYSKEMRIAVYLGEIYEPYLYDDTRDLLSSW